MKGRMIFLSKFLPIFLYPTGLITILIVLAFIFWKKRKASLGLLLTAFVILVAAGNKYSAGTLARSLEWQYPALPAGTTADVIVVLSGGTEPALPPRSTVEINSSGDRVLYAARLYQEGSAPVLLLTGGNIAFLGGSPSTPADDMATLLELTGVPRSAMIIENQSQNTLQNAQNSCAIIKAKGYTNLILVTSAFHMPRSVALFEAQGCPVIPAPTDFSITEAGWQQLWHPSIAQIVLDILPSSSNLSTVTTMLKEYFGMGYYRLTGIIH